MIGTWCTSMIVLTLKVSRKNIDDNSTAKIDGNLRKEAAEDLPGSSAW